MIQPQESLSYQLQKVYVEHVIKGQLRQAKQNKTKQQTTQKMISKVTQQQPGQGAGERGACMHGMCCSFSLAGLSGSC